MYIATETKLTPVDGRAFAAEMQTLTPADGHRITELSQVVLRKPDQGLQKAAIIGLERIGSPEAILVITRRLWDTWGMSAICQSIRALAKLRSSGRLLALTSTPLVDYRSVIDKLQIVGAACLEADSDVSADWLAELTEPDPLYTLRRRSLEG